MDFYQFMVPRLEGDEIESDFNRYLSLVKKGVAGFIIFGGEVEQLRNGIRRLQEAASLPLIISSDLEQGLGQQVRGGTVFPPALAIGHAERKSHGLAREVFTCMAREASYVGINTIFAPVLDINTNPSNPIISTRAFSDGADEVSSLGTLMIKVFGEHGITSCGKHFPGHGDTSVDSHLQLPRVDKTMAELEACELKPFRAAVEAGVPMIMVAHLSVPALDPIGTPASISKPSIGFLKEGLGFSGIIITDAMNMGGLGSFSAGEAALMALDSGADMLLHPSDPDALALALQESRKTFSPERVERLRASIPAPVSPGAPPPFCEDLSLKATRKSILVEGEIKPLKNPFVLIIGDEGDEMGEPFIKAIRKRYPSADFIRLTERTANVRGLVPDGADLVVAIYSRVRAFTGGAASWITDALRALEDRARAVVSFGSPHVMDTLSSNIIRVFAWWDSGPAQLEAARKMFI